MKQLFRMIVLLGGFCGVLLTGCSPLYIRGEYTNSHLIVEPAISWQPMPYYQEYWVPENMWVDPWYGYYGYTRFYGELFRGWHHRR